MFRPPARLTFDTAHAVLEAGLSAIDAGQTEIDLSPLKKVDSAAIVTFLAWQRAAHSHGKKLTLTNWPTSLTTLAHLYDVVDLL